MFPKLCRGGGTGGFRKEGRVGGEPSIPYDGILQPVLWGFRKVAAMRQSSRSLCRVNAQRIMPLFHKCNIMQMTKEEQALTEGAMVIVSSF